MRSCLIVAMVTLAALLCAGQVIRAQQPPDENREDRGEPSWMETSDEDLNKWGNLPEEIAEVMSSKAEGYQKRALGFSCLETIRYSQYHGGYAGKERLQTYDYLLVSDPLMAGGFSALRTRPGSGDTKGRRADLPFPEPYLFHRVFSNALRSTLRFKVGQWHTTPWRLAIPISWIATAPVFERRRISEWSGTLEVEYLTGNILRVVASPNYQEDRLEQELQRYLTAFRFLGFSAAPPPIGLELTIDYGFEHDGYFYPTRVEVHTFRQIHRSVQATVSKLIAEYSDYRFFGIEAEDEIPPFLYQPPAPPLPPARPSDDLFDDPFKDF